MEKKLTIKELEKQYLEAEKNFKKIKEQFDQAKKEEEDAKKAKLEAERETRYNEIITVYKHFEKLRNEYVDDYGYFTFESINKKNGSFSWFKDTIGLL